MRSRKAGASEVLALAPPPPEAAQAQTDAYVAALREEPEAIPSESATDQLALLMASLHLVPRRAATHVALWDGDWNDPKTWYRGQVPCGGARVLIPDGVHVQIGALLETRIFTIRVDGELEFATDVDSRIVFDTLVVTPTGSLLIGTELDPVPEGVTVDLLIADNGSIDPAWDPARLSRGIVSHGQTIIHGTARTQVASVTDPVRAGDSALSLGTVPPDWQIGDAIIVASPSQSVRTSNAEARVIADLDAETVYFDEPLFSDQLCPVGRPCEVFNLARSISIETEHARRVRACERGHILLAGDREVSMRFAELHELGRPDAAADDCRDTGVGRARVRWQGRHPLQIIRDGQSLDATALVGGNSYWRSAGQAVAVQGALAYAGRPQRVPPARPATSAGGLSISSFGIAWQEGYLQAQTRPKHSSSPQQVGASRTGRNAPVRVSALYSFHYFPTAASA
jgi:hypothetical protein